MPFIQAGELKINRSIAKLDSSIKETQELLSKVNPIILETFKQKYAQEKESFLISVNNSEILSKDPIIVLSLNEIKDKSVIASRNGLPQDYIVSQSHSFEFDDKRFSIRLLSIDNEGERAEFSFHLVE